MTSQDCRRAKSIKLVDSMRRWKKRSNRTLVSRYIRGARVGITDAAQRLRFGGALGLGLLRVTRGLGFLAGGGFPTRVRAGALRVVNSGGRGESVALTILGASKMTCVCTIHQGGLFANPQFKWSVGMSRDVTLTDPGRTLCHNCAGLDETLSKPFPTMPPMSDGITDHILMADEIHSLLGGSNRTPIRDLNLAVKFPALLGRPETMGRLRQRRG